MSSNPTRFLLRLLYTACYILPSFAFSVQKLPIHKEESYLDVLKILKVFGTILDIKRQIGIFYLIMSFKGRKFIADKALSKMGRKKLSVWMKL